MKNNKKNPIKIIYNITVISMVVIIIAFAIYEEPLFHFWKSKNDREIENCMVKKPLMNYSLNGNNYCFTTHWNEYCKIIDPKNCPQKEEYKK